MFVVSALDQWRFDPPRETWEHEVREPIHDEIVLHDARKYFRLLLNRNGYVLEQIFSPIVVYGEAFLKELRPIAQRCITRHHYKHYFHFARDEWNALETKPGKMVKRVLYVLRVLLTGVHLMRTGEVNANLPELNAIFSLPFVDDLIATSVRVSSSTNCPMGIRSNRIAVSSHD